MSNTRETLLSALTAALTASCGALAQPVPVEYLRRNPIDHAQETPRVNVATWDEQAQGPGDMNCFAHFNLSLGVDLHFAHDEAVPRMNDVRAAVTEGMRVARLVPGVENLTLQATSDGRFEQENGWVIPTRWALTYQKDDLEC